MFLLKSIRSLLTILTAAGAMLPLSASASSPTPISLTTTNGTVPGTSITYTISNTGGTPRNIFPAGTSDQGLWSWTSFPEFLALGTPISLAVTFSAPIPANRLIWGANSVTPPSTTKFTPSGGTATAANFNLTDGISAVRATGPASYNAATGTITANSQDVSLMVGSASTNTLASFTISATNNTTDGYTVFFGFTAPAGTGNQFTFSGFASTAGLTLVGNAATASTSDGTVLRLAAATGGQSGAAYSTTPVTLGNNAAFNTQFQFRFTNPGGWDPADGITFVITTNTTGLGAGGLGMGYQGVSGNSVAIEFDTFNNTGMGLGDDDGNSSNHVAIDTNGVLTNTDLTNVYSNPSCGFPTGSPPQNSYQVAGCMSNGHLWTVNIGYDGTKLTVTLSDPSEGASFTAISGYTINLASILGQNTAYVGFTSGTGSGWENHDIVNWSFANTVPTGTPSSGCSYAVAAASPLPAIFGSSGGSGTAAVMAGTGCTWAVTSSASWLTTSSSGSGNGSVSYTVAANTANSSRTATLTVGSQILTVTQAAAGSTCSYYLEPQSINFPAAGGSGTIDVSTQSGCAASAAADVSWIHIGSSSASAVSYQVDANSSSTQRTGAITIANGLVPVAQDGVAVCTYSLSPPANAISALGGSDSVRLTTAAGCPWTASVSASGSWFHLTSSSTGTAGANLSYTADANTTTQSRTASITVSGATFTLTQAAGAAANAPAINAGGIENAASSRSGTIAQGSYFAIYGANLGPAQYVQAPGFPIPDNLSGVVVTVAQGSYSKRAYLNFVYASQINAILPSDTPLGTVQITVSYNGVVGASFPVTVVATQFGAFSVAYGPGPGVVQNFNSASSVPLNTASQPLKPGQIAILWGTGLGPITTGDNTPPPGGNMSIPTQVSVGGVSANILYTGRAPGWAGVDNVYFNVPSNAPTGCSVPVQVTAAGVEANTIRVAISSDGSKCQDTANPFANTTASGGNTGTLGLMRVSLLGVVNSTEPPVDSTFDIGLGIFSNTPAGGDLAFSPFMNLPPVGTCVSTSKMLDLGTVIGSSGLSLDNSGSKSLDAGTALTVTGPKGSVQIPHFDPNSGTGPYVSLLGGKVPVSGSNSLPPFLEPGSYTITGPGGKDVGKFSASLTLATPLNWTNQSQITSINRSAGVTLTWSGGDPGSTVLILGGSTNQQSKNSGGFGCLAPISAGTFTVPSNVLMDLPPTGAVTSIQNTIGMIALGALPLSNPTHFAASGLTNGLAVHAYLTVLAVPVQ